MLSELSTCGGATVLLIRYGVRRSYGSDPS
jgi:hypothetical protein